MFPRERWPGTVKSCYGEILCHLEGRQGALLLVGSSKEVQELKIHILVAAGTMGGSILPKMLLDFGLAGG